MKQKSFDAVRQKSRVLAVLLCLAVLLLTGCGTAAPAPDATPSCTGTARVCSGGGQNGRGYGFFSGGTRALRISIGVQFDGRV